MTAEILASAPADGLPSAPHSTTSAGRPGVTSLDVVIPVYNEQDDLGRAVRRLHSYLTISLPYSFSITIADNASTDATSAIADELTAALPGVRVLHVAQKGRGRALKAAWLQSDAAVLAYMDVDLSTDLAALLPLIAPLLTGHSELAIGTRLAHGARVVRGPQREFISLAPTTRSCGARWRRTSPTPSAVSRRSAPTSPASCYR